MAPEIICCKDIPNQDEYVSRSSSCESNALRENLRGRSSKSDVWSLGIILLELISVRICDFTFLMN